MDGRSGAGGFSKGYGWSGGGGGFIPGVLKSGGSGGKSDNRGGPRLLILLVFENGEIWRIIFFYIGMLLNLGTSETVIQMLDYEIFEIFRI